MRNLSATQRSCERDRGAQPHAGPTLHKPVATPLSLICVLLSALVLSGCAAKAMVERTFERTFERASTRLAEANFAPDARYAVAVALETGAQHSMHGPIVAPLAEQLAIELQRAFGMETVVLDHSPNSEWTRLQQLTSAVPKDKDSRPDRGATAYSPFLRQAGYQGYALLELQETTDGFSRNEYDYSVRGRLSLRTLETDEKGEAESLLARVNLPQSVCSRRLRNPPVAGEMIVTSGGYRLTNPERCTRLLGNSLQTELEPLATINNTE